MRLFFRSALLGLLVAFGCKAPSSATPPATATRAPGTGASSTAGGTTPGPGGNSTPVGDIEPLPAGSGQDALLEGKTLLAKTIGDLNYDTTCVRYSAKPGQCKVKDILEGKSYVGTCSFILADRDAGSRLEINCRQANGAYCEEGSTSSLWLISIRTKARFTGQESSISSEIDAQTRLGTQWIIGSNACSPE